MKNLLSPFLISNLLPPHNLVHRLLVYLPNSSLSNKNNHLLVLTALNFIVIMICYTCKKLIKLEGSHYKQRGIMWMNHTIEERVENAYQQTYYDPDQNLRQ